MSTYSPIRSTVALALALGCDATGRGRDASLPSSHRVNEILVRVDAPAGGAVSVSVLAFRADVMGAPLSDVLGVVDPLVAATPEGRCEVREVAAAARTLRALGGAIELSALANVIEVSPGNLQLRPVPRVYPTLAAVVGGVIGEAGPLDVPAPPERVTVAFPEAALLDPVDVPAIPRLLDAHGAALTSATAIVPTDDLQLVLVGPPRSFVEVRPFGATSGLACPAGPGGRVVVPGPLLDRLLAASGPVPVAFEAVWRESRPVATGGHNTRLSLEVRSQAVLSLRP